MNTKTILLAGTLLTAALAARADGTITWAWSTTIGPGIPFGSGTFTSDATETTSGANTGYLVTDMTGSIGAGPIYPITGLGGIGDFNYYAPTDNLLIPTSATTATVDAGGVAFYIQGNGEALFLNIGPLTGLIVGGSGEPVSLSITEISESVPEPGVTALAVAGGLGLLGFRRKQ